jgi:Zn-dependent M32 family carboxypeptidase
MRAKVSVEFFNRLGRVKEELEAVDLSREVIRKLRDSEYAYSGYLTLYLSDGSVTRLYFNDLMPEIIPALNNILEETEMEVAHA